MSKIYLVRTKLDWLTESLESFKTLQEAKAYAASINKSTFIEIL